MTEVTINFIWSRPMEEFQYVILWFQSFSQTLTVWQGNESWYHPVIFRLVWFDKRVGMKSGLKHKEQCIIYTGQEVSLFINISPLFILLESKCSVNHEQLACRKYLMNNYKKLWPNREKNGCWLLTLANPS